MVKALQQSTESLLAGGLAFTFQYQLVLLRVSITNENVFGCNKCYGEMNTTAALIC